MSATEKSKPEVVRKRKPAARRSDIVIALLEDRLDMIAEVHDANPHVPKMRELFDELKRSIGRKDSPESGEEG